MPLKQITCKHCNATIEQSPIIIGETESIRQRKAIVAMAQHIQDFGIREAKHSMKLSNGKPFRPGPHHNAQALLEATVQGITEYAVACNFNLSEDLEQAVEAGRHSIHEASRKVRMSDADLQAMLDKYSNRSDIYPSSLAFLCDLRDRYEGLGKYAPAPPAQREEVKQ